MEILKFESNTKGKIEKILNGSTFNDVLTVITEMFQNAYRAKAKKVDIRLDSQEGILFFSDDGTGCKNPKNIITLDFSEWDSTDEGFGIGLMSWLALPCVEYAKISSNDWAITVNVATLLNEDNPLEVTVERDKPKIKGFTVELKSSYFKENDSFTRNRIISDGEIQLYDVILNGCLIHKRELFDEVSGEFIKEYSNGLFDAKLTISKNFNPYPSIYYENRYVDEAYGLNGYIEGVVKLRKKAVDLKEPDRKSICNNEKKQKFIERLVECKKKLYLEFVKNATQELIDEYSRPLSKILDVDDYEKLLEIEDFSTEVVEEKRNVSSCNDIFSKKEAVQTLLDAIEQQNSSTQLSVLDEQRTEVDDQNIGKLLNYITGMQTDKVWVNTGECIQNSSAWQTTPLSEDLINTATEVVICGVLWKKIDVNEESKKEPVLDDHECEITFKTKKRQSKTTSVVDAIRKTRKKVWIKASDINQYSDLVAKAEYYGLRVFVAKNIMYENVYYKHSIPYITELKDNVKVTTFINNIGAKTGKEESFLKILTHVCKYYSLPYSVFQIADLKLVNETWLDGMLVDREIIENTKKNIKIMGLCEGEHIYFDRKALALQRFNLSDEFGKNHYRVILACMDTLSHELAHYMHFTTDATVMHYQSQIHIASELEKYFNSL